MLRARQTLIVLFVCSCFAFSATAQQQGRQLFSSTCAACHGLDGRGGEHAPNIATEAKIQALTDRDLVHIVKAGIPNAGMPGFEKTLDNDQIHAVVEYLRILQGKANAVSVSGDADNGRALFFGTARCSSCHMLNGQGGFLGPDLSGYGGTHPPDEIRTAIVSPNKDQDPRRGTVVVITNAGKKYTGVLRNEDNFSLQLQTPDGNFHLFDKSRVRSIEHLPQSMMPNDYESQLGKKGVDDLISYLVKASATTAPAAHANDDDDQ